MGIEAREPSRTTATGDVLYHLQGVAACYGKRYALTNVQLLIKKGEILFITGPSGAGKTTLLKILEGSLRPTSGSLSGVWKDMFIAPVFQDQRFLENVTCRENIVVSFDPDFYQNRAEFERDMIELCKLLNVEDRLDLPIKNANGGLRQKIAIIRALLTRPDVLLLDEPTSSLDTANSVKVFEILKLYNLKRGMSVIWTTHNRDLVRGFSQRTLYLQNGSLMYAGQMCFI